jgi:hypothetical protein
MYLETLTRRKSNVGVMFVFDVLSGADSSPNLLPLVNVIDPRSGANARRSWLIIVALQLTLNDQYFFLIFDLQSLVFILAH